VRGDFRDASAIGWPRLALRSRFSPHDRSYSPALHTRVNRASKIIQRTDAAQSKWREVMDISLPRLRDPSIESLNAWSVMVPFLWPRAQSWSCIGVFDVGLGQIRSRCLFKLHKQPGQSVDAEILVGDRLMRNGVEE
jgi:hypothetical protein